MLNYGFLKQLVVFNNIQIGHQHADIYSFDKLITVLKRKWLHH